MNEIYLSKGGKQTGPFTEAEIARMKASGEIYDYTYIWDVATQAWKAIPFLELGFRGAKPRGQGFGFLQNALAEAGLLAGARLAQR